MKPTDILIDARNFDEMVPIIIDELSKVQFAGIDTETHDDNRHEGLNLYCKYDEETRKKSKAAKLVFDVHRTVMTGFSIWPEHGPKSYYVNLNQADVENRIPWEKAVALIDALPEDAHWVAHNASYELTMFRACYGYMLPRCICTMQMAVSAFGPDEYSVSDFQAIGQGGIKNLVPDLMKKAHLFNVEKPRDTPKPLAELMSKVLAKESKAAHSYNGLVKEVAYTYGLKRLVQMFFGEKMTTFEEVLGDDAHMGQLTGEQVVAYGADDAVWAMKLFRHLMAYMAQHCPDTIPTFFSQENPMVGFYSDMWYNGMVVNSEGITARRATERETQAIILRELKQHLRTMLPFRDEPDPNLMKLEKWYSKGYEKYRRKVEEFAWSAPEEDDFLQCMQVRGPVSNAWADERKVAQSQAINVTHYMPARTLLYDLTQTKPIVKFGKVQSDGECRGQLKDRFQEGGDEKALAMIDLLNQLAGLDQRMKLYLTPYSLLMDPETGKLYPTVSSMLASRRMAASTPNPMQLAKRGDSTYVRGFFQADYDDHVILSVDWSGIELVEIGEFSADPEFIKAFGQLPHEDLHGGAAADILAVEVPGLDADIFAKVKQFEHEDDFRKEYGNHLGNMNRLFTNLKGESLPIEKVFKYWRTEIGKGANFNYWYSGFLGTVGDRMGWDISKTGAATDKYRQRFSVAEQWRVDHIELIKRQGFVNLPDGHRRVRFEATDRWYDMFMSKFMLPMDWNNPDEVVRKYNAMWAHMAKQIQKRAFNQAINSIIQGSCATIAKRSVISIEAKKLAMGWTDREMRFMIPIHDELLFSVHRSLVNEAIGLVRGTMIDHPDLFQHCMLDATPAIGRTFEPWNPKKAPTGQIELYEAPKVDWLPESVWDGRMNADQINQTVDYLFAQERLAA